ncbi:E3 ubiquitin-protein ligase ZNF598, partial [Geosmithia morbida]
LPDERTRYTAIIDAILATADLETISRKKIRQGLETSLGGKDLSEQKNAIKELIEERFDHISEAKPEPTSENDHAVTNGAAASDAVTTDPSASPEPARKKAKRSSSVEDADARLAAQLQAQENRMTRGRSTRGGNDKKKVTKKKAPRKKSAKQVGAGDDNEIDGSEDSVPAKRKAGGGFQKPFLLSPALQEITGETQLSRPHVVKSLWQHIKANGLQDPSDKRQILCDDKMQAIFKQSRVDMFKMNKDIGHHLYPIEDSRGNSRGGGSSGNNSSSRGGAKSGGRGGRGNNNRSKGRGGGGRDKDNASAAAAAADPAGPASAGNGSEATSALKNPAAQDLAASVRPANATGDQDVPDDDDVCFICANTVTYHSITPCNHSTCHICGLRMRALYKDKNCAHCRTAAPYVIFSQDPDKRFEEYTDRDISTTDTNIGIKYAKEDIVGDTVLLLRYNCPSPVCDFAGLGWPDLHRHVQAAHKKRMCDLCTRNKRVFTHEHELFSNRELDRHMESGDDKPGAADQTGFKGHPKCGFCSKHFYDDDKLYEHCRMAHERCFLCDRRDSRQPHYYRNYQALEDHFRNDHFLCRDEACLEKKFVVFESELDLQAHNLEDHSSKNGGGSGREARLVNMSGFEIRESFQPVRRGGGGGGDARSGRGGRREGSGRGRDHNAEIAPVSTPQTLRRDEIAFQRQLAIHSAQSVSNRTFGGQLTASAATPAPAAATSSRGGNASRQNNASRANQDTGGADLLASQTAVDPSSMTPEERARLVRHGAVVERASNLVGNDQAKLNSFRGYISSYKKGGLTAPQLIDSFFTLFSDTTSSSLGTLVKEVADLFEDRAKADGLRSAWQDWRAINEDYPSLPGLSGMHGETSTSTGWASAGAANPAQPAGAPSQRHSNRVLKLKDSTRLAGPSPSPSAPSSSSNSNSNWVARASGGSSSSGRLPSSSAAFPSLPSSSSRTSTTPSASGPSWTQQQQQQQQQQQTHPKRPTGQDAFPSLPAAPKPTTTIFGYGNGRGVRRDLGRSSDTGFQWGGGSASASGTSTPAVDGDDVDQGQGQGKKGKKGKKVLLAWG